MVYRIAILQLNHLLTPLLLLGVIVSAIYPGYVNGEWVLFWYALCGFCISVTILYAPVVLQLISFSRSLGVNRLILSGENEEALRRSMKLFKHAHVVYEAYGRNSALAIASYKVALTMTAMGRDQEALEYVGIAESSLGAVGLNPVDLSTISSAIELLRRGLVGIRCGTSDRAEVLGNCMALY